MNRNKTKASAGSDGLRESMAELAEYGRRGMNARQIADDIKRRRPERVHFAFVPARPGSYPPAAVRKLRDALNLSQATFAAALGVSTILLQGWEQGVRKPSALASRLLDTIARDPAAWLVSLQPNSRRAG